MSSFSSGGGQDPSQRRTEASSSSEDEPGPFITVVSVDGGLQTGNKLTVITPTEINEPKQGKQAVIRKLDTCQDKPSPAPRTSKLQQPTKIKDSSSSSPASTNDAKNAKKDNLCDASQGGAAYVTVLALTESQKPKSSIPVRSEPVPSKKSVVNICKPAKGPTPPSVPPRLENVAKSSNQTVTIANKPLILKEEYFEVKNASIVEITMKEAKPEELKIREQVVVYRLPGERLGFALKFDGGTSPSPLDKVNHLIIQSCAEGSPAKRTETSWGGLGEGDEIVEIENVPVSSMTRMDCVQSLKDSSVAVKLLIEHVYTVDEINLIKNRKELAVQSAQKGTLHPNQGVTIKDAKNSQIKEEVEGKSSKIPVKRGHSSSSSRVLQNVKNGDALELKLQPPVGFEDELRSHQLSVGQNNYERNKSEQNTKHDHYHSNEVKMNESAIEMNTNSFPEPSGSNTGQNPLQTLHPPFSLSNTGSNGSLNTGFLGPDTSSVSICGSDETESTRSTVVSRLSVGSSMTSISMGISGNFTDCNNNSLSQISEGIPDKRKRSPNSSMDSPSLENLHDHLLIEGDLLHHHVPQQVRPILRKEISSEIPLEPPLSFQDAQEQVKMRSGLPSANGLTTENDHQYKKPASVLQRAEQQYAQLEQSYRQDNNNNLAYQHSSKNIALVGSANKNEELFDDEELALLADELGLDQEDEDLFKAMLAEIEANDEDLEEYGPILAKSSPSKSSSKDMKDEVKKEEALKGALWMMSCDEKKDEIVVSAKLGKTTYFNANYTLTDCDGEIVENKIVLRNEQIQNNILQSATVPVPGKLDESWVLNPKDVNVSEEKEGVVRINNPSLTKQVEKTAPIVACSGAQSNNLIDGETNGIESTPPEASLFYKVVEPNEKPSEKLTSQQDARVTSFSARDKELECCSKTKVFVEGLPVKEQMIQGNDQGKDQATPPSPPKRLKGSEKRLSSQGKFKEGEKAVEKINKLAKDVHSTEESNSLSSASSENVVINNADIIVPTSLKSAVPSVTSSPVKNSSESTALNEPTEKNEETGDDIDNSTGFLQSVVQVDFNSSFTANQSGNQSL